LVENLTREIHSFISLIGKRNMMLEKQDMMLEKQDETIDAIDGSKEEIVSYGNKLFINPFLLEKEKRCRKRKKSHLIFFTL